MGFYATFVHICIGLTGPGEPPEDGGTNERHCHPDTGFEIRALVV